MLLALPFNWYITLFFFLFKLPEVATGPVKVAKCRKYIVIRLV